MQIIVATVLLSTVTARSQKIETPPKAERDLTFLFKALLQYQLQSDKFPSGLIDLRDTLGAKNGFSLEDWQNLKPSSEENIDAVYTSKPVLVRYVLYTQRPDGTSPQSVTQKGLTDVYFSTSIYSSKPNGEMGNEVIVRSNGNVESIPEDEVFYCPESKHGLAFPMQAGIPPLLTLRFGEDQKNSVFFTKSWKGGQFIQDNGGPESLLQLSRRLSYPGAYGVAREALWNTFNPFQSEFTIAETQLGAKKLGLNTQFERQTLAQLQKTGTPALLFLQDDGRIVTLTAIDDDRAVVIDRGLTQNIERSVLEKRYSGEALIPTKALTQNTAIVADDAVREVKLPSLDTEVPQQFTLRNTGATPITLQLEYPLLGVTESKLSRDVIAPGETATLDIKVKWRSILKAPYQNVLVSIATNDPIVPRLQLAVLLTPPTAAGQ